MKPLTKALRSQETETVIRDIQPRSSSTDFVGSNDLLKLWKSGKPKIKPTPRPIVGFRQLCSIAKDQYQPLGGWKDAIMSRVTGLGYATPDPQEVRKAMEAVDHVHRLSSLPKPKAARMAIEPSPRPISKAEASAILADLFRRFA